MGCCSSTKDKLPDPPTIEKPEGSNDKKPETGAEESPEIKADLENDEAGTSVKKGKKKGKKGKKKKKKNLKKEKFMTDEQL